MTLIDKIRDMLADGQTKESLEELYAYVKEQNADVIDHLVMLRSRMRNLEMSEMNGTIDDQDATLERAKINEGILKLLPQLTPEYLAEAKRRPAARAASPAGSAAPVRLQDRKWPYVLGGAVGLLVLLMVAFGGGDDNDTAPATAQATTEQEEAPAPSGVEIPAGTLLYDVLTEYDGHAVWQSELVPNQAIYTFELTGGDAAWAATKNGRQFGSFKMTANTAQQIVLYDASQELFVYLNGEKADLKYEGDASYERSQGGWVASE